MQTENSALVPYVEGHQLDRWFQSALDLAKEDFAREVDLETDEGGKMSEAAQDLEKIEHKITEDEKTSAEKALHRGTADLEKFKNHSSLPRF